MSSSTIPQRDDPRQENPHTRPRLTYELANELQAQGLSDRQIGERFGVTKQRAQFIRTHPLKGAPHSTVSAPGTPKSAPQSPDLESRVAVLEAYIKVLQSRESIQVHPVHSNGAPRPARKQGFVVAVDLLQAIHRYAEAYHLQVKVIVDEAFREFFERRGFVVGEGER